ncbi:MAG TPA: peptide ABC transporter permease [Deltaproteobacteria bacterium]|jgi:peptide/nickel transport system permease protein|nr:peptide ABC transporter permease [Deltaproteobacteria bacterium]
MWAYVVRRLAYSLVTVLGVLLLLFVLFFLVTNPDDIARKAVGEKAPPQALEQWKKNHGYDKPRFWNQKHPTDTMLVDHFRRMLTFDFGNSDADDTPIWRRLKSGAGPSLSFMLPLFVLELLLTISLGLLVAFFRETYIDRMGVILCVLAMSISTVLYIIGGQYLIARVLRWFPISGFDPSPSVIARFLAIPVLVGLLSGVGDGVRFYRAVFVEESGKDYVRTARAKGCGEGRILVYHVLRNSLVPILTQVVVVIPYLVMGSILLESFFGIPGLGSITFDAINANDFATLRTMVYLGSLLFILGQILTDVSYTVVDPRVRLE